MFVLHTPAVWPRYRIRGQSNCLPLLVFGTCLPLSVLGAARLLAGHGSLTMHFLVACYIGFAIAVGGPSLLPGRRARAVATSVAITTAACELA